MTRLRSATLALLVLSTPVFATEPTREGGFADIVSRGLYDLDAMAPLQVKVGEIRIGDLTVGMEQTSLEDIAATLGGPINNEGEAGEHMVWTCYGSGQSTIWFMSDGEMGDGKLTIFAVEAKAPRLDWNCGTLPADMTIDAGIPGLAASSAEVRSIVGPATAGADGRFSYTGEAPSKTEYGFTIYQDVVYEERDGSIVAFAIEQLSEG
jgi:hypothetical protein